MTGSLQRSRQCALAVFSGGYLLAGCASLEVDKVANGSARPEGVRYCLPKPFLQATPQVDGTVAFDVIYLPDSDHCYAIKTKTDLSSYSFQISRDEKGLLTAIEFKASTAIVGQQLLTSAGAAAVQDYNLHAAQQAAVQTAVNTAAGTVDSAKANLTAAQAALDSDRAHTAPPATITSDYNALAQAEAKFRAANDALQRVQQTGQATSTSVTVGSAAATTAPVMGTIFGQPTWPAAAAASNLPSKYSPVLFAINDSMAGASEIVQLAVVDQSKAKVNDSLTIDAAAELEGGVLANAHSAFETVTTALGPPSISPVAQSIKKSAARTNMVWVFSRPIVKDDTFKTTVATDPGGIPQAGLSATVGPDLETVSMDVSALPAGDYAIAFTFTYKVSADKPMPPAIARAKFTITPPSN
jgi:hypothetical protein